MGASYRTAESQPWTILSTDEPSPPGETLTWEITENRRYPSDPTANDLNPQVLKKKLGHQYEPSYVSLTKDEAKKKNGEHPTNSERKDIVNSMPEEIKNLDFRMPGTDRHLGPKASKKLQLWLWQHSRCSVKNKWKDLGARSWPRYLNIGRCSRKASCSFPKGMRCQVSETRQVAVLRWHCRDINKPRQSNTTCKWITTNLPVVQACKCMCWSYANRVHI